MKRVAGSFRDPSGFVYEKDGDLFRVICSSYQNDFDKFINSGLCEKLIDEKLLIPFTETASDFDEAWKTIHIQRVPFISYPYEWSFAQFKDAAITTLNIQLFALSHAMSMKDASAYNIQFWRGEPVLIDQLSFECLEEGMPWNAYRQFVTHFFGPLTLMAKTDTRHALHLQNFIDGIPLDYISSSLPAMTWLNPQIFLHLHLHARLQKKYSDTKATKIKHARDQIKGKSVSVNSLKNIAYSLRVAIEKLKLPAINTEWADYYVDTNYTKNAFLFKKDVVNRIAERYRPRRVCDLGANDGEFSRILAKHAEIVISADIDPLAVNKNYQHARTKNLSSLIPVLQDLCNPSPALGWANEERSSFLERARSDFVMGLALVHHLCITNNVPLPYVANLFNMLAPLALIEFVPKEDSQVQRLLSSRKDIFIDYSLNECIKAFSLYYEYVERIEIPDSCRTLLLFSKRQ